MKKVSIIQGVVAPLKVANIDTDIIMPKQFLKSIRRTGYGQYAFDAWRYEDKGEPGMDCTHRPKKSDFVLNKPEYAGANILLTEKNFGCGSSREHAVWGLVELGIEAVIAPSFAEIFYNNSLKNGLLPVSLSEEEINRLFDICLQQPKIEAEINLEDQTVNINATQYKFEIPRSDKIRLMQGLDDIGITLKNAKKIKQYEALRKQKEPWIFNEHDNGD